MQNLFQPDYWEFSHMIKIDVVGECSYNTQSYSTGWSYKLFMSCPNIWFGVSLYVACYEITCSVCSVCTMNEYAISCVHEYVFIH
jgi:hypothetical protein